MKKIVFILLVAVGLFSFTKIAGDYTITGTATGVANGKKVTLERQDSAKGSVVIDSAKVVDGKFTFKGTALEPSLHFIQVEQIQGKVAFILESGKINCTIYKDSIAASKIGGTKNNDDLQDFNSTAMKIQGKIKDFQVVNNDKWLEAQAKKDTATTNKLMGQLKKLNGEMMDMAAGFPAKNPKSFISILFVDNMFGNPNPDIEKIQQNYNGLDVSLKNSKLGKALKERIDNFKAKPSTNIGSLAPEFSAPSPEGTMVSLKQSLGKITIIDFWASWCGPCRKENPNVVALYNELHPKGLNIIGVSLDKDGGKWKEAIAKDNLTWTHVSNLKFWQDPIAQLYGVQSIPATFILDAQGKIVARDLRGAALKAKVIELLGQ